MTSRPRSRNTSPTPAHSTSRSSQPRLRCAIYTRKSTEEGLDQEFNSLDAQREACAAFIASQVGLGWHLIPDRYDDGGISGGTMERPALQRLLQDIKDRKVDVVVVYKIDRLTRSLADFAKIVEVFDGQSVSFVSVTQQFNTTSSMGRLTLNVLLSFAQFEREVTAERIRDKIAASRKKGMWMGGTVPLGYKVQDRKLLINEPEATSIRGLFHRYLELKSVPQLAREVSRQAAEKARGEASEDTPTPSTGFERYATRPMFHGMLYKLLTNPIYIGKVRHHDELFDGEHEPLIDVDLFEAVRRQLAAGAPVPQGGRVHKSNHLLSGLLYDDTGDPMGCVHTRKVADGGIKRYLYYMSRRATKAVGHVPDSWRIPACEINKVVRGQAIRVLQDQTLLSDWVQQLASTDHVQAGLARAQDLVPNLSEQAPLADQRETLSLLFSSISLSTTKVRFEMRKQHLVDRLIGIDDQGIEHPDDASSIHVIELPVSLRRRGLGMRIVIDSPYVQPEPEPALVDLIARSHIYLDRLTGPSQQSTTSIAEAFNVDRADVGRILPLAFLSPKMLDAILSGTQPETLTPRDLARNELPILWSEQDMLLS
ncbi:MAG: recombinase family protein [Mesorhizobium sp.]